MGDRKLEWDYATPDRRAYPNQGLLVSDLYWSGRWLEDPDADLESNRSIDARHRNNSSEPPFHGRKLIRNTRLATSSPSPSELRPDSESGAPGLSRGVPQ